MYQGAEFNVITITPGAYKLDQLNIEIERNNLDEGYAAAEDYPFTIKSFFRTLDGIVKITTGRRWQFNFVHDDTL